MDFGHKKARAFNRLTASEAQAGRSSLVDEQAERIARLAIHKKRSKQQEDFLFNLASYKAAYDKPAYADEVDMASRYAYRLGKCGNFLLFHNYYTLGETRLVKRHSCDVGLLCCGCAAIRAAKAAKAYQAKVEHVMQGKRGLKPVFITYTVKNGECLRERMEHLQQAFRRILDRRRDSLKKGRGFVELSKLEGGVFSYEFTKNPKTGEWHPHVHMFALANQWLDQEKLAQEWLGVTGDSFIVDVRRVKKDKQFGYGKAFAEVCKYALKFSDLSPSDTWQAFKILKGHRLSGSFGCLWGVEIPKSLEDDPIKKDDLPYLEMVYLYKRNAGYSLEATRHIQPQPAIDDTRADGLHAEGTHAVNRPYRSGGGAEYELDANEGYEEKDSKDVAIAPTSMAHPSTEGALMQTAVCFSSHWGGAPPVAASSEAEKRSCASMIGLSAATCTP